MLRVVFAILAIMLGSCQVVAHISSDKCNLPCLRLAYAKPTDRWLALTIDDDVIWTELAPIGIPPSPTPLSELGKRLFFETALSSDGKIACITCHDPRHAFADPRSVSFGVYDRQGSRNSQSLTHLGLDSPQHAFFLGRTSQNLARASAHAPNRPQRDGHYARQCTKPLGKCRIPTTLSGSFWATDDRHWYR